MKILLLIYLLLIPAFVYSQQANDTSMVATVELNKSEASAQDNSDIERLTTKKLTLEVEKLESRFWQLTYLFVPVIPSIVLGILTFWITISSGILDAKHEKLEVRNDRLKLQKEQLEFDIAKFEERKGELEGNLEYLGHEVEVLTNEKKQLVDEIQNVKAELQAVKDDQLKFEMSMVSHYREWKWVKTETYYQIQYILTKTCVRAIRRNNILTDLERIKNLVEFKELVDFEIKTEEEHSGELSLETKAKKLEDSLRAVVLKATDTSDDNYL